MQASRKRRGRPPGASGRGRKKQRRLDSIADLPLPPDPSLPPRRSSRPRRAPDVLDSSPLPASRRRPTPLSVLPPGKKNRQRIVPKKHTSFDIPVNDEGEEAVNWGSRLRSRSPKGAVSRSPMKVDATVVVVQEEKDEDEEETETRETRTASVQGLAVTKKRGRKKKKRKKKTFTVKKESKEVSQFLLDGEAVESEDKKNCEMIDDDVECGVEKTLGHEDEKVEEVAAVAVVNGVASEDGEGIGEDGVVGMCTERDGRPGDSAKENEKDTIPFDRLDDVDPNDHAKSENKAFPEEADLQAATPSDVLDVAHTKEGRRCGLCGRGHDGKPPKKLIQDLADSDNEVYNGLSAAEEPNYDVWDGFGDEPEWLGRLLGPIRDQFGIARVWVHQNCIVWSPEVYFAGLGCLKNVRAALCRGRALKCCRCGRPGATIGCRVDRCPKTYHLPCARADNSIFDHRKFLIACSDHRHLFQPRGDLYARYMKKQKIKKLKMEIRKTSNEASRKDFEAEEKWLDNCGEDEEFLKRERKRLHRDILRIAPIYIGGSSTDNKTSFQGWESVAGLHDVICCMKEVVILPLLYPEFFSSLSLTPPRGVLLHGHPGTGKTLLVRALIGECARGDKRIAYFARKGADCLGKYVGDAERQLRLLFQVAEKSQPSIIFFDEIDGLAPCRSKRQDQTHSSVVSTLLSLMDGLKSRGSVIVIGATNRPDSIDPALRRPGRFDREVYFPLPSAKDRSSIVALHTRNWPRPLSEPALTWIANRTAGYAGADLQALCTQVALTALKRNCPLQEILSSAERGQFSGRPPNLPSFVVEERDWLAALSHAPPPCSRREAGVAANDIVSSPLQYYLLPPLIYPLSQLLMNLYFEERVWLPPSILRASKGIWNTIIPILDQKNIPRRCWMSHLHDIIQDLDVAQEVGRNLSHSGLLISLSSCSNALNDNINCEDKGYDSYRGSPNKHMHSFFGRNLSMKWGTLSGFRALIDGTAKSGQQHLAACIIHGFVGHVDIQKVNLATISQEGHGDIIQGMTQILSKCFSLNRCVIYMPRIDLWAVHYICELDTEEKDNTLETVGSSQQVGNAAKSTSQAWDLFVEQVDSACISKSLIILATSEVQIQELPYKIRDFFTSITSKSTMSANLEHTVPRFSVVVEGKVNSELLIDLASAKLTVELVRQYVQKLHARIHFSEIPCRNNGQHTSHVYAEDGTVRNDNCHIGPINCHAESGGDNGTHANSEAQPVGEVVDSTEGMLAVTSDPDRFHSNNVSSIRDNRTQEYVSADKEMPLVPKETRTSSPCMHTSTQQKPALSQYMSRNLRLAVSSFGNQILRFPHFAELCWATSKLKEGPSADITMPVKSWPFNSCIVRANNSANKTVTGSNTKTGSDCKGSGTVRGLLAVGLLAQRGAYTSVGEVSLEVRNVLELFIALVNAKIMSGKDRIHFHRILSQVAYLDDMVNSWAYAYQSAQVDNHLSGSNFAEVHGDPTAQHHASPITEVDRGAMQLNNSTVKSGMRQEFEQKKSKQNLDPCTANAISQSTVQIQEHNLPEDMVSAGLKDTPNIAAMGHQMIETSAAHSPSATSQHAKASNDLSCKETPDLLENNLHNQDEMMYGSTGLHVENDCTRRKNINVSAESEVLCVYDCCTDCLYAIRILTRETLTNFWKSRGCCTTVDDINDVVSSCSATTLALTLRHLTQQSIHINNHLTGSDEARSRFCSCSIADAMDLDGRPFQPQVSSIFCGSPVECTCHPQLEVNMLGRDSIYALPSRIFFKNNIMVSPRHEDTILHCNFAKIRHLMQWISCGLGLCYLVRRLCRTLLLWKPQHQFSGLLSCHRNICVDRPNSSAVLFYSVLRKNFPRSSQFEESVFAPVIEKLGSRLMF